MLREGTVFSRVCLSVYLFTGGSPCDHYPWCTGPCHTGTLQPSSWPQLLVVISGGQDHRPVQTCSLEEHLVLTSGLLLLKHVRWASGQLASYWNAFLFCYVFHAIDKIYTIFYLSPPNCKTSGNLWERRHNSSHQISLLIEHFWSLVFGSQFWLNNSETRN